MNIHALRLMRNVLLRCALIGLLFAILLGGVTFLAWDTLVGAAAVLFTVSEDTVGPLLLGFFSDIRFLLIFVFLTPALALHWTIQRAKLAA